VFCFRLREFRKGTFSNPKKFRRGFYSNENRILSSFAKHGKRKLLAVRGPKKLQPELGDFLDACVVPALVEKFFAERRKGKER
jgi:hypothetical protein